MVETWTGDVDCVVFLQTIEHVQDPGRRARPAARARRSGRRRLRLDAERAHARAGGRGALGQSLARARVPAGGVPRAVRAPLRARRAARAVPRPPAAGRTSWRSSTRAGTRSTRGSGSPSRSTTASRRRSPCATSACAATGSSGRSTCSPSCGHEAARRPRPRPPHAHALRRGLRDVAVRRGVAVGGGRRLLPAAARRPRRGARPRDAVGHAGARRPARGAGRARPLRDVPARDPPGVARARPRAPRRDPGERAALEHSAAAYAARRGSRSPRGDPRRGSRAHATLDLGGHPRDPAAAGDRRRRPAPARDRHRGAPRAVRRAGAAGSGCPSAPTRRGSTRCWRRRACGRSAST